MKSYAVLWAACCVVLSTPALAEAPSFDCAKASTVVERTICKEAGLSAMDRKLTATYAAKLALISEPGRKAFRDGQRQWIGYVGVLCDTTKLPKASEPQAPKDCIKEKYDERQKQLDGALSTIGGIRFLRTDVFKAVKSNPADQTEWAPPFGTLEVSVLQIDAPKTRAEQLFNAAFDTLAKKEARAFTDGSEDRKLRYDTITVTGTMISVRTSVYYYGHGAAHGMYGDSMVHWLRGDGRELKATDVFTGKWKSFLRERCFRDVKQYGFVETVKDLNDSPQDPKRWIFTKEGLTVVFNPYEVASYAEGTREVKIPWNTLKPYLSKTAPIGPS